MVRDEEAKEQLFDAIYELLFDEEKSKTLSENIKKLAILDAADRIAKEVLDLIAKK